MAIIECPTCNGKGVLKCDWCDGKGGKSTYKINIGYVPEVCTKCNGKGTKPCSNIKCTMGKLYNV